MEVIPFNHGAYKGLVEAWLVARHLSPQPANDLPATGFLVLNDGIAISAGFLRLCEGGHAMIDSLVTDPSIPGEIRNRANDLVTETLVNTAKSLGIKQLIAFSVDAWTIMRAERHGFTKLSHTVMVLPLLTPGHGV